jgi:hypothetical protein
MMPRLPGPRIIDFDRGWRLVRNRAGWRSVLHQIQKFTDGAFLNNFIANFSLFAWTLTRNSTIEWRDHAPTLQALQRRPCLPRTQVAV